MSSQVSDVHYGDHLHIYLKTKEDSLYLEKVKPYKIINIREHKKYFGIPIPSKIMVCIDSVYYEFLT